MKKKDIEILKSLYNGNHLSDSERDRAIELLYLLDKELKSRV